MSAGYIDEMHEAFHSELTYRPEEIPLECTPGPKEMEQTLHGVMKLNGLIIRSLEEIAGRGANAVTYRAGKKFGHEIAKYFQKREDVEGALRGSLTSCVVNTPLKSGNPRMRRRSSLKRTVRPSSTSSSMTVSSARRSGATVLSRAAPSARPFTVTL
ncbi:MAG: hypothetical protein RQM90_02150 [Methanoculleus sp.]